MPAFWILPTDDTPYGGWAVYSKVASFDLTTEPTTYTDRFTMAGVCDPTARLEFELGLNSPDVYIGDVSFTIIN